MLPHLAIGGSHFGPQLLMEVIAHCIPIVEIPVNCLERVGTSSVTGGRWKAFKIGMTMIFMIWSYWLGLRKADRRTWAELEASKRYSPELFGGAL